MAETTTTGAKPGSGATPEQAADATPEGATPEGQTPDPATGEGDDKFGEAGRIALRREREVNNDLRAQLRGFEAQVSDVERQGSRIAELERSTEAANSRIQELNVELAVHRTAPSLGITKPHIAARLVDRSSLEFDDAGNPTNIQKVLERLVESDGDVLAPGAVATVTRGVQSGGQQPRNGTNSIDKMIRQAAGYE